MSDHCFVRIAVLLLVFVAGVRGQQPAPAPLPPIQSAGDAAFGKGPTRTLTLPEVGLEIVKVDQAGAWMMNKKWEILINSLQPAEVPALLEIVEQMRSEGPRTVLTAAFYSRWAEADPAGAMAHAQRRKGLAAQESAMHAVLQGWSYANPKEVLLWSQQLPDGSLKNAATTAAIGFFVTSQPGSIVGVVKAPDGVEGTNAKANSLSVIAAKDPRAAAAEAAKIPQLDQRIHAYQVVVQDWAFNAPEDAVAWAQTLPAGERDAVLESALTAWARKAPERALSHLAAQPASRFRQRVLGTMFNTWASRDFPAAIAWTGGLAETPLANQLRASVVSRWLAQAPDDVIAFALTLPWGGEFSNVAGAIVNRLVETDPPQATAFLRRLPAERRAGLLQNGTFSRVFATDPEGGLALLKAMPPISGRAEALSMVLVQLARRDPAAAEREVQGLAGTGDEASVRRSLINALAEENPDFALALFAGIPAGAVQAEVASMLVGVLGRKDVNRALAWARTLPAGPVRFGAVRAALRGIAETNPRAALAESKELPAGPARDQLQLDIAQRWATNDLPGIQAYVRALEDAGQRAILLRAVARSQAYGDPAGALDFILSVDPRAPAEMLQEAFGAWAQSDPMGLVRWADRQEQPAVRDVAYLTALQVLGNSASAEAAPLVEKVTAPEMRQRSLAALLQGWARFDPVAAGRWAEKRGAGPLRDQALAGVAGHWGQVDFTAAAAWLKSLPAEIVPDGAFVGLINVASYGRPAEASALVMRIKDPPTRFTTIESVATAWLRVDRAAALRWLAETDLPPERRDRLLNDRAAPAR